MGFFVGLFLFCVVFLPSQGRCYPFPLDSQPPDPLLGAGSTLFKPRVFCLWVCILVALSDFCFIISSNRLWCQKH